MSAVQFEQSTLGPWNHLKRFLPRSQFARSVLVVLSGSVLARAVLILSMPVLARCYRPEMIGVWQLFAGLLTLLSSVICLRYEIAIMLPEDEEEAASVFWLSAWVALGISVSLALAGYFLPEPAKLLINDHQLSRFLWLVPPVALAIGLQQASTFWLNRHSAFTAVAHLGVIKSASIIGFPISLYFVGGEKIEFLIVGTVVGQLLVTVLLLRSAVRRNPAALRGGWNWQVIRHNGIQYRSYPFYVAPIGFVTNGATQLVYILLTVYASSRDVGLFAIAMQFTNLPVTLISQSLNQVFFTKLSKELADGKLQPFVLRILMYMVVAATPLAVLFASFATELFGLMLGSEWRHSGSYAVFLTVPSLMMLLTVWLNRIQHVAGRQRLELLLEVSYSILSSLILAGLLATGCSAEIAIAGHCATTVIYHAIWLCVTFHVAGFELSSLLRPLACMLVLAGVTLGICQSCQSLFPPAVAAGVSFASVLLVQLVAAVCVLRSNELWNFINRRKTWKTWKDYWEGETKPGYGDDTDAFYGAFADELRLLLKGGNSDRVLEIGCGNGALYPHLGFTNASKYRGVDLSSTMISEFERNYPGTSLVVCEGEKYEDNEQYDLIFSNQVIQFFNPSMLDGHLRRARKMLVPGGRLILASNPWRSVRSKYMSGELMGFPNPGWLRYLRTSLIWMTGSEIGRWYDHGEIAKLGQKHGFAVRFCGSLTYPYRFHAILTVKMAAEAEATERRAA